jgi:Response regulator containing a CheY-like receiver domain and an HD-GYP domain
VEILVADDDIILGARLLRHLENIGHTVHLFSNGSEALDFYTSQNDKPHILITDWMMPKVDGITLAKKIRKISENNTYTYVILLTSKSELTDIIKGFTVGCVDDYITKPFSPEELTVRIKVGERVVRLERQHKEYSQSLETIVQQQQILLQKTKDELIERLLDAVELRDQETGAHVQRIGAISSLIAHRIAWNKTSLNDFKVAAAMHDIGKVGIPDTILRKPGPLSPEEYTTMQEHTIIGASILSGSSFDVIQTARDIALWHHERWDGKGYPNRLAGDSIPVSARIVSIVDVFDALANDRIYRRALPPDQVLKYIQEGAGTQFDPELVKIFFELLDEIWKIEQNQ